MEFLEKLDTDHSSREAVGKGCALEAGCLRRLGVVEELEVEGTNQRRDLATETVF